MTQDIEQAAQEQNYRCEYVSYENEATPWLNIFHDDDDFWQWIPISEEDGDLDGFEPSDRAVIAAEEPASAFIVVHHATSIPSLRAFLKRVLERYGGWVSGGGDNMQPIYTVETIENLRSPDYSVPDPTVVADQGNG